MSNKATNSRDKYNLTEGGILQKLLLIALPVIGSQIVQMTYNLTDVFWLGRTANEATSIAATGTVGMFIWLSQAFLIFGARGAEIGVSQNIGRGDRETAKNIAQTASFLSLVIGAIVGLVFIVARRPMIGFFNIQEQAVVEGAELYQWIVSLGFPFLFLSAAITGIYNGSGNSKVPLVVNIISLAINFVLDPLLILTFDWGIAGAAIATIAAQIIGCIVMVIFLLRGRERPFDRFTIFAKIDRDHVRTILRWTTPIAIESFLFTFLSMIISRFISAYGESAIAAQKVGSQIESLSWLIAGGFSSALTAYVGQNFGAGKWKRIDRGVMISSGAMLIYGALISIFMFLFAEQLYGVFVPKNAEVIAIGVRYLRILASCQLLACLEAVASGAFRGLGKTMPPSIVSVSANTFRVLLAFALSRSALGIDGIWIALAVGGGIRGLWMYLWYLRTNKKTVRARTAEEVS